MPRYHFNVKDGNMIFDSKGSVFADDAAACDHAQELAKFFRTLDRVSGDEHRFIAVVGEDGAELFRVKVHPDKKPRDENSVDHPV
jgi:hypothetical protein